MKKNLLILSLIFLAIIFLSAINIFLFNSVFDKDIRKEDKFIPSWGIPRSLLRKL